METKQKAAISQKGGEDDDGGEEDAVEEEGRCRRLRRGGGRGGVGVRHGRRMRGATREEEEGCTVGVSCSALGGELRVELELELRRRGVGFGFACEEVCRDSNMDLHVKRSVEIVIDYLRATNRLSD